MSNAPSAEQLRERIRTVGADAAALTEMQRLGFWSTQDTPEAQLIQREAALKQQLASLGAELQQLNVPLEALKEQRRERMAAARLKREQTRQRRAQQRFERAQQWRQRQQQQIYYLGDAVSAGLNAQHSDITKLETLKLPVIHDAAQLAAQMGISLAELRFLAFNRRVSRVSHYRRFALAKKTGGQRIISAPMPRLKRAQYWILDNLLQKVPLHPAAHGFVKQRSIVSNASPHIQQALVINLDLKNFFPSIDFKRIKGVFKQLGYAEQVATTLALLCSEAETEYVTLDGASYFVAHGARVLPQGAPSSPALTNILCKRLDARLHACAAKLGFVYTRYADDLTFSGNGAPGKLLWRVKQIIADEGFTSHPDKQQIMRKHQQQHVTGIVVNQKPHLARDTLKRFRATLFQVERDGPVGKHWQGNDNVLSALEGYARFINMVDAGKGTPLLNRVLLAKQKWAHLAAPGAIVVLPIREFRRLSAEGKAPWPNWWQPQQPAEPVLEKTQEQIRPPKVKLLPQATNDLLLKQRKIELAEQRIWRVNLAIQAAITAILTIASHGNKWVLIFGLVLITFNYVSKRNNWKIFLGFMLGVLSTILLGK